MYVLGTVPGEAAASAPYDIYFMAVDASPVR
jgi:hypothetical protein